MKDPSATTLAELQTTAPYSFTSRPRLTLAATGDNEGCSGCVQKRVGGVHPHRSEAALVA